jgi:hypothetical protein
MIRQELVQALPLELVPSGARSRAAQAKAPFWKHVTHTNQISPHQTPPPTGLPKVSLFLQDSFYANGPSTLS